MTVKEITNKIKHILEELSYPSAVAYLTLNDKKWLKATIKALEQEPKTGHWIEKDGFDGDTYYDCSECGESWTMIEGTPWDNEFKYCPNCGCRMG